MIRKYTDIIDYRLSFIIIFLIIIHQSLIASSIIFLTDLILKYQEGFNYKPFLFLYLASMIFPYFLGILSYIYMVKLENKIHYNYFIMLTKDAEIRKISYRDKSTKEDVTSILARNSFSIISSGLYFLHDFITLFLNSFLSVLAMAFVLPYEIAIGYIITSILSFLVIIFTRKVIENRSIEVETKHIRYSSILTKFIDNISIANKLNITNISAQIKKQGFEYYNTSFNLEITKQLINLLLAMISLLPTSYLIVKLIGSDESTSKLLIAAIIVNITRIFTLLSSLNALLSSAIEIPSLIGRLKVLFSPLQPYETPPELISGFYINNIFFEDKTEMSDF